MTTHNYTLNEAIELADEALLQAKHASANGVIFPTMALHELVIAAKHKWTPEDLWDLGIHMLAGKELSYRESADFWRHLALAINVRARLTPPPPSTPPPSAADPH